MSSSRSQSSSPYFTIWFSPQSTVYKVLSGTVNFKFYIPILLAALSMFISDWKKELGPLGSIAVILLGAGLTYFIIGHFFPWLIIKTGKIWNGKGSIKNLQLVLGLAQIPVLLILLVQLLNLAIGILKVQKR